MGSTAQNVRRRAGRPAAGNYPQRRAGLERLADLQPRQHPPVYTLRHRRQRV
jgi:hypothetical protein